MQPREIRNNIRYIGVNDRSKALFENLWPIPGGVSYNSYIIEDSKNVIIDTVDTAFTDIFLRQVRDSLGDRHPDYLIVNHAEPDHSGSITMLINRYPKMQIVGNARTFDMLAGFYGITDNLHEVKDGDSLSIGSRTLTFHTAPMVHWPEVMFTYDQSSKTLFSADAFGTYGTLDGGITDNELGIDRYREEMIRYYSNIIGKYGNPVQRAIRKLDPLDIQVICSTHGPVWNKHLNEAVSIYERMSRYEGQDGVVVIYGSMYGNTEQMAEAVARAIAENGVPVVMHNLSKSHSSYILRDIFNYRGIITGSPTYSNRLFPEMESLLEKIALREVKNRLFGCFGSYTWASASVKHMEEFACRMKWQNVGESVEQRQGLTDESYSRCYRLGQAMAERIKEHEC